MQYEKKLNTARFIKKFMHCEGHEKYDGWKLLTAIVQATAAPSMDSFLKQLIIHNENLKERTKNDRYELRKSYHNLGKRSKNLLTFDIL